MIKRKILAFIAIAAMISASAQTSSPKATNANAPDSASLTVATPTDTVSIVATSDSAAIINFHSDEAIENAETEFDEIDESYYSREDTLDALLEENIAKNVVALIIVIFLIPCLTIGFIVWIIMRFFIKRNRERNSIIEQAINAGYQLPETFYTGQPNNYNIINGEMAPNTPRRCATADQAGHKSHADSACHQPRPRQILVGSNPDCNRCCLDIVYSFHAWPRHLAPWRPGDASARHRQDDRLFLCSRNQCKTQTEQPAVSHTSSAASTDAPVSGNASQSQPSSLHSSADHISQSPRATLSTPPTAITTSQTPELILLTPVSNPTAKP